MIFEEIYPTPITEDSAREAMFLERVLNGLTESMQEIIRRFDL